MALCGLVLQNHFVNFVILNLESRSACMSGPCFVRVLVLDVAAVFVGVNFGDLSSVVCFIWIAIFGDPNILISERWSIFRMAVNWVAASSIDQFLPWRKWEDEGSIRRIVKVLSFIPSVRVKSTNYFSVFGFDQNDSVVNVIAHVMEGSVVEVMVTCSE